MGMTWKLSQPFKQPSPTLIFLRVHCSLLPMLRLYIARKWESLWTTFSLSCSTMTTPLPPRTVRTVIWQKIWETKESLTVPLPKKGNLKQKHDYCGGGGFFLACEDLGKMFNNSFPACFFFLFFFLKWRLARTVPSALSAIQAVHAPSYPHLTDDPCRGTASRRTSRF